ncbi:MAG: DUF5683 domain-containing protein [Bernardetiaceae bacterium]
MKTLLCLLLGFCGWASLHAQDTDSMALPKPTRAALLSAVLPGAGQIYNKKGWQLKVPVIYTGAAILGYLVLDNHANYKGFRDAYTSRIDNNPNTTEDIFYNSFSNDGLIRNRDNLLRDRDFYIILSGLWYLLNIAEAATTAHLNEFNISDDLALRVRPFQERVGIQGSLLAGLSIQIPLQKTPR